MKKLFNLLKEKLSTFSFKRFLIWFTSAFIANIFSVFLGNILLLTSLVYLVTTGIVPSVKTISSKITNFFKSKFNKLKERKKGKKHNLFKSKNKENKKTSKTKIYDAFKNFKSFSVNKINSFKSKLKREKKEEANTTIETEEKTNKIKQTSEEKKRKHIPNVIKNFKLFSTNKYKEQLEIKRDVNGYQIVNGSYRIIGKDIIDNKTHFIYPHEYSQKTYVKTK